MSKVIFNSNSENYKGCC